MYCILYSEAGRFHIILAFCRAVKAGVAFSQHLPSLTVQSIYGAALVIGRAGLVLLRESSAADQDECRHTPALCTGVLSIAFRIRTAKAHRMVCTFPDSTDRCEAVLHGFYRVQTVAFLPSNLTTFPACCSSLSRPVQYVLETSSSHYMFCVSF